mgnify:CR=1 FL=1
MIEKVAIIGAGAWGMALALHLAREKKCAVSLWSVREASRNNLKVARGNDLLLPGIVLPSQIWFNEIGTNLHVFSGGRYQNMESLTRWCQFPLFFFSTHHFFV